jgi:transcriptional regulator with XRE-family HTH domain
MELFHVSMELFYIFILIMFLSINIKHLRSLKRMTQTDLATEMGVTPSTVAGWETGKSSPHLQVLLQLRSYFEVDLESLVYRDLQKEMPGEGSSTGINLRLLELFEQLKDRVEELEDRMKKVEG